MNELCMALGLCVFFTGLAMDWNQWKESHRFVRTIVQIKERQIDPKDQSIMWSREYEDARSEELKVSK